MLNINQVIKAVNAVITKSSDKHVSGLATSRQIKPQYNHSVNGTPKLCRLNLEECKEFYKTNEQNESYECECPFGFTVAKNTFKTPASDNRISIYSLLKYKDNGRAHSAVSRLPREIKKKRDDVMDDLSRLAFDHQSNAENHQFLVELIETLLVGRVGISIQGLSHQLFTPLQGALSDLQNLKNGTDRDESIARLDKNLNSLNRLAMEVQLLMATSEEFNHNMLRRVTVHTMIAEIIASLEAIAQQKYVELRQGFNQHGKTVQAIPGQLHMVLSNVIENAVKYSFNGFQNSLLPVTITYTGRGNEGLRIDVANEGCQITHEEIHDRLLFDLGYRGKFSNDKQRRGTGIGLYIADIITRRHGGTISVTSRIKGGSIATGTDRYLNTFSIVWPYYIDV